MCEEGIDLHGLLLSFVSALLGKLSWDGQDENLISQAAVLPIWPTVS